MCIDFHERQAAEAMASSEAATWLQPSTLKPRALNHRALDPEA